MPDDFAPVRPGDDVTFSARVWNAMLDAGRVFRNTRYTSGAPATGAGRQGDIVRVVNDTGEDLRRCAVVGLDSPAILPGDGIDAFLREVTFRGVAPDVSYRGRFGVLLDPAPAGRVARAFVAGVCPVRVFVSDPDLTCADASPSGGTAYLETDPGGSAQLLWVEPDDGGVWGGYGYEVYDGARWGIIRFGTVCQTIPYTYYY